MRSNVPNPSKHIVFDTVCTTQRHGQEQIGTERNPWHLDGQPLLHGILNQEQEKRFKVTNNGKEYESN